MFDSEAFNDDSRSGHCVVFLFVLSAQSRWAVGLVRLVRGAVVRRRNASRQHVRRWVGGCALVLVECVGFWGREFTSARVVNRKDVVGVESENLLLGL